MGYSILVLEKKTVVWIFVLLLVSQIVLATAKSQPASPIHIFLSFRGADTRENFASLIYDALFREGFNVFMDDESIRAGQDIDLMIREAINNSMGAVIIFSKNFASSGWCLDELILILGRKRESGSDYVFKTVYVDGVQPEDLLDQRGSYGKALTKHKNKCWFWNWEWRNKVKAWRSALKEVAGYRGMILSGKWANFINEIVEEIRQQFIILGITVTPRRSNPTGMDHAYGFRTIYEIIKKLAIVGNLINHNGRLLAVFMLNHFIQQQPHDQFVQQSTPPNINKTTAKFEKGSGVWGGLCKYWGCQAVLFLCSIIVLSLAVLKLVGTKQQQQQQQLEMLGQRREIVRDSTSDASNKSVIATNSTSNSPKGSFNKLLQSKDDIVRSVRLAGVGRLIFE